MPPNRVLRGFEPLLHSSTRASRPTIPTRVSARSAAFLHTRTSAGAGTSSARPHLQPARPQRHHARSQPWNLFLPRTSRRTLFIQTEPTPNADALKFLPNHRVLPEGVTAPFVEYLNPRSTIAPPYPSPLASRLMSVDGVTAVFYGADFITVTKAADASWAHIRPEVFSLITEAITSGQPLVNVSAPAATERTDETGAAGAQGGGAEAAGGGAATPETDSLAYDENDSEVVGMIKELLETRVRPAIQEDGGDIEFRGFEDGYVLLKLRGACRTCDSSTVTLKNGIEGMLMHYIEEVKGVHQVLDQEEEIALKEFAKFEEKLKAQKNSEANAA
ncbi:hypothetical protein VTJ83DRAFT_6572 [Remersonia thermophila]|uniref:Scaffold protein Nfu/NifU N-terminal domain-containing protein n=1 Tax=Remersonia thermophila TaxID=72144 RepID=A0ABR4D7C4_9PEZI